MTLSAPPQRQACPVRLKSRSSLFHNIVTIGQSVPSRPGGGEVYDLLNSINLVVFGQVEPRCLMPKLSHYMSYAALAAALFVGFAVTVLVGFHF